MDWRGRPFPRPSPRTVQSKLKDGGLSETGNFLARPRGAHTPTDYVVCVIHTGKPTYHLCVQDGGKFKVNTKACGGAATIQAVVATLRTKQPFWPCPLTEHAKHPEAGRGATHRAKTKKTSAERAAKQKESEPEPAPEAPAVPRTAEEPNANAIADAAAAAVKKAEEDAVCEAEKNTLAAAEKAARVLADPHKQRMGGDRRGAKNLRTDLSKGFGFGLASKLRIEGAPFDCFILCFSFGASSFFVFFGWSALDGSAVEVP